jgi:ABC-type phosphate/phosphonate transport system substrate-binding protein
MNRIYLIFILCAIMHIPILLSSNPSIAGGPQLYFFNPDSAQSNLGQLKHEMETYFDRSGYPVSFQAFSHQTDFDAKINERQPEFLFAPEWYIKKHGQELKIKPFLVPVYKGATTYHKVLLVANGSRITLDSAGYHSLAMTTVGPDTMAFLSHVLFPVHSEKMCLFRPVIVPKSSDALFALFLGQVDSALVVQEHLLNLKKMLPRIIGGVRPLALSKPLPMPMLCYSEKLVEPSDVEKFKSIFLGEKNNMIRKNLLESLQIDEWQETSK